MPRIRFNHVFLALMFMTGLSAFVIPQEKTNLLRGRADGLFAPVAFPVRKVAQVLSNRGSDRRDFDAGSAPADAVVEINRLRTEVAGLSVQIEKLRQLNANRDLAGRVGNYARPFKVSGGDGKAALTLVGSASDGVTPGMAVVCSDALVGRVSAAGATGIQVQLVTHQRFSAQGAFYRYARGKDGTPEALVKLATPPPLIEGRGAGRMAVMNLTWEQVEKAGLAAGDLVLLDDNDDWSLSVSGQALLINGQPLGVVEKVAKQSRAALFAEITVRPQINLLQLDEVMVVTGKLSEGAKHEPPRRVVDETRKPAAEQPRPRQQRVNEVKPQQQPRQAQGDEAVGFRDGDDGRASLLASRGSAGASPSLESAG